MQIPSLNQEYVFDTYYLALGKYVNNEMQLISIVSNYLNRCKNSILQLLLNEIIYLPFDFSDQYYGAFKVHQISKGIFKFEYGSVLKTANVSYDSTDEFIKLLINNAEFDIDFDIVLTKSDIINSFKL
jgi:hypothetical protein